MEIIILSENNDVIFIELISFIVIIVIKYSEDNNVILFE